MGEGLAAPRRAKIISVVLSEQPADASTLLVADYLSGQSGIVEVTRLPWPLRSDTLPLEADLRRVRAVPSTSQIGQLMPTHDEFSRPMQLVMLTG